MNLESIMARRGKLQPVIKLKQRREQQAGKQLQQCNEQREHHSQLLNQLKRYREEYLAQMERALKGGTSVTQLDAYRAMLAELDDALVKQKTALQWAENDWRVAHEAWQVARSQVEALSGLSHQYARQGQRLAEVIEQDQQEDAHRNRSH